MAEDQDKCPECGAPLTDIVTTQSGRQLKRCSTNVWNKDTRQSEGCGYVLWLEVEPKVLDEECPKCGAPLVFAVTKFGKKMKKCSKGGWDKETRKATGCDFVEWQNGEREELNEKCPDCGAMLVLVTTNGGKRLKKCSTAGWDAKEKMVTGCQYIEWQK
ncbi:MAG: hypothetical protein A2117_00020 [Candidatus Wildermuthbacteria bacterium GWA2_46_15]|uniref:Uncharacterized protein n=1 Tax=Candidatus Wildermuthbacteria bacterium GWA2_46_15 TaxID=1802443 RepID=A0A1G2QNN8_9BACT|nr:MAG: hypothetical protein A2117_00020 [Candidatus Wildermuthbacteria bacterium GWA2_46_15]